MIVVQCSSCTARGFHPFSEASSSSPTHHTPPLLVFSTRTTRAIDPSRKQRLVTSISLFKMSFYDFHFAALASEVPKPSPAAVDTSSSAHNSSPPAETSSEESPSASSQSFAPEATAAPETPAPKPWHTSRSQTSSKSPAPRGLPKLSKLSTQRPKRSLLCAAPLRSICGS